MNRYDYLSEILNAGTVMEIKRVLNDAKSDDNISALEYDEIKEIAEKYISTWNL